MWETALNADFAVDLDRDGDIDLIGLRGGTVSTGIFMNLSLHAHSNAPSPGGTLDLEINGTAGALVAYGIGFARSDVNIPGLGWWSLDPALSVLWPRVETLDALGAFRASWPIPNHPSLTGLEIFVQAAELRVNSPRPIRFTNLWRTRVQ